MMVVLILMLIFAGVATFMAVAYVNNTNRATGRSLQDSGRSGELAAGAAPEAALPSPGAELTLPLLLSLPEPARTRAWALLSGVTDALKAGAGDTRTAFLLAQTRDTYLPDTLRAYAHLTPAARQTLERQGQPPEVLLDEQLALLEDGMREALRHDHAAADRLLTQGRFLRERFGAESAGSGLRQKP
ncbi:hypothetical protein GCM10008961_33580 [Deinococcus knuensis]|uniref:Integral membrane protein n=2 Tax=Deinococcus knuensis TaxID=1837380 RepID=A0ABQ2SUP1_9DEIO|nr:hypothetical protein GCM10008961_33580 [Deinococcus knuensis]